MQVLSDLIPITNGEVFDIIRRNREQRNIKSLPHFHAQSIGSITGSSAHQALALQSRFAHRDAMQRQRENRANELVTLIQPSVLASGSNGPQPHNTTPHMEIKLLHYLQRERDFYGPTSVVMGRFAANPDYNDSDNESNNGDGDDATSGGDNAKTATSSSSAQAPTAASAAAQIKDPKLLAILAETRLAAPTPLAEIARAHHDKIEQGLAEYGSSPFGEAGTRLGAAANAPPPSDPAVPSLFHHESTRDNVVALEYCLARLRDHGQAQTRALLASFKARSFVGTALVEMLLSAWEEQTASDKQQYIDFINNSNNGGGATTTTSSSVNKSTIERGVAKRLSNLDGNTAAAIVGLSTAAAAALYAPTTTAADSAVLAASGLPVPPLVLRNLVDLRHSLTSEAHVAAVIPTEMAFMGDLAEFVLRYEAVRAAEERHYASLMRGGAGGGAESDAFAARPAQAVRFQAGVEDPTLRLPQTIVEGFRYSAVMALCTAVLGALGPFK